MFNSPHIIELYELVQTNNNFYAFIEYANGGSLQNLLHLKGRFSELVAREILIQIVKQILQNKNKQYNIINYFQIVKKSENDKNNNYDYEMKIKIPISLKIEKNKNENVKIMVNK